MLDKLVQRACLELAEVLLKVGAGGLRAGADGHRLALVVVGRRTGLIEVSAQVVVASDEQADAEGPATIALRGNLRLGADLGDEARDGHG